jgi:CubicO group peptidase (beta-lactamase class C family)
MRSIKLLLAALGATAWSGALAAPALSERDLAAIAALEQRVAPLPGPGPMGPPAPLAQRMADARVPAVSVAMIEEGRVKWARAYGEAVAGSGRVATLQTRFQAGSLSKPVAAAGALRMVDQRRLALDADVAAQLRGWRVPAAATGAAAEKVTLRRLLSHTAGLSVASYPGYPRNGAVPTLLQSLGGLPPAATPAVRAFAAPGAQLGYSGGGYSVAQLLMSERAGLPFARLMDRLVLRPLGMRRSTFEQGGSGRAWRDSAAGHDRDGRPVPGGSRIYPELAAAGLWTTPSDYGRFVIALQDSWAGRRGALLEANTARAMMTLVLGDYGLGVTVAERRGRRAISHGGANEGFECRFVAFLDGAREGLVVMTNGDNGGALAAAIQRTIGQAYRWPDTQGPRLPYAPDE